MSDLSYYFQDNFSGYYLKKSKTDEIINWNELEPGIKIIKSLFIKANKLNAFATTEPNKIIQYLVTMTRKFNDTFQQKNSDFFGVKVNLHSD